MPLLLYAYCLAEVVPPTAAAFFIFNAVLLLGQLVPLLDVILNFGINAADLFRLIAYLCPPLFFFSVPLAFLTGVTLAFSRMTSDGEVMALKACGTGVHRLLGPVLLVGLVAGLLTAWVAIDLMPKGETASKELLFHLARERFARGLRPQSFNQISGDFMVYVERRAKAEGTWEGIFVTDSRDQHRPVTIVARQGSIGADATGASLQLVLRQGSLHRVDGDVVQTVFFDSYRLVVPLPRPRFVAGTALDEQGKHELGLAALWQRAATAPPEEAVVFAVEFHKRLAVPVGAAVLAVLGLPLGLLARPGRRAIGLPLGIAIYLLYFLGVSAAGGLAETGAVPAAGLWIVDGAAVLLAVGMILLTGSPKLDRCFEVADAFFYRLRRRRPAGETP